MLKWLKRIGYGISIFFGAVFLDMFWSGRTDSKTGEFNQYEPGVLVMACFFFGIVIISVLRDRRKAARAVKEREAEMFDKLLGLAREHAGELYLSDVVTDLGIGLDEAEELLEAMLTRHDSVIDRVLEDEGTLCYRFPEIIKRAAAGT